MEYVVLLTTMAEQPGPRVCEPTVNRVLLSANTIVEPTVIARVLPPSDTVTVPDEVRCRLFEPASAVELGELWPRAVEIAVLCVDDRAIVGLVGSMRIVGLLEGLIVLGSNDFVLNGVLVSAGVGAGCGCGVETGGGPVVAL